MSNLPKNDIVIKVMGIIGQRTIDNPITGGAIALQLSCKLRQVASAVEVLRNVGIKVASSKGAKGIDPGYFLARSPLEMEETNRRYRKTCLVQLKTVKKMHDWKDCDPSLFEGHDLKIIDDAIKEYEEAIK